MNIPQHMMSHQQYVYVYMFFKFNFLLSKIYCVMSQTPALPADHWHHPNH